MLPERLQVACHALSAELTRHGIDPGTPWETLAFAGRGRGRGVNFVVFLGGSRTPVLFLKTAEAEGWSGLEYEYEALERLASLPAMAGRVPQALGLTTCDARRVLVLTAVGGAPMTTLLRGRWRTRRSAVRSDLTRVRTWLDRFQRGGVVDEQRLAARSELLSRYAARLADRGELTARRRGHLERLQAVSDRFSSAPLPVTWSHGDLWPGNILVGAGGVAVVDWQHFATAGAPFSDLWFFLLTYTHALPARGWCWLSPEEAFRRAFLQRGWYPAFVRQVAAEQLSGFGVPEETAELLLFLFLLERAETEIAGADPVGPRGLDWGRLAVIASDEPTRLLHG